MDINCRNCEKCLAKYDEIFFFVKSGNEVSLLIKPECKPLLESSNFLLVTEVKKRVRLKCKRCFENVGRMINFGPCGASCLAFGTEKIVFLGNKLSKKVSWRDVMTRYQNIERRSMENFFGRTRISDSYEEYVPEQSTSMEPVKMPQADADFAWFSLTPRKVPRNYQIDAYIEALQQDLVVVMDTGLGKTLIASMVIAKMKALNPSRMGVMLVDRIPLVFQQGHAIINDTGLRVCCLCGENRTTRRIMQLHDGTYDVLVITAGSFHELLSSKRIEISNFCIVVFDECHHATGDHIYKKVLEHIIACSPYMKPRVLGLTASPFKAKNVAKGRNQLEKFRRSFVNAAFFYPNIQKAKATPVEIRVERDPEQSRFIAKALIIIQQMVNKTGGYVGGFNVANAVEESQLQALKGQLKGVRDECLGIDHLNALIADVLLLIETIEICEYLGVSQSIAILKESQCLADEVQALVRLPWSTKMAPRLLRLESLLETQCSEETRAIIFVKTQVSAMHLFHYLEKKFPDLSPGIVLGHGGFNGMNWDEEQRPTLRDFRKGKKKLLVATSVLEEGLDVAECDLVIRYSGPNTLINFIQSRGRARKEGSKFYVFADENQSNAKAELEDQEIIMRYLIQVEGSRDCLPSARSKQIKDVIVSDQPIQMGASFQPQVEDDKSRLLVVEFYLRSKEDETKLSDALVGEIEEKCLFKVHRLCSIDKGAEVASGTSNVFTGGDKAYLTSLKSELDDVEIAYEAFCKQWDFELHSMHHKTETTRAWCKQEPKKPLLTEVRRVWSVLSVEFGNFTSNQTFECSHIECRADDVPDYLNLELEFNLKKDITLRLSQSNSVYDLAFPLTSLHEFAILCVSPDGEMPHLYLPLKRPPKMKTSGGCDMKLSKAAVENKVICFSFLPESWKELREALAVPEIMPVSVFNTRIKHDLGYPHLLKMREAIFKRMQSLNNCLWLMEVLKGNREFCVPNRVLLFLYEKLQMAYDNGHTDIWETAMNHVIQHEHCYWVDLEAAFNRVEKSLQNLPASAISLANVPIPANHKMVKRVVITPKRLLCFPENPVGMNRLLRYYGDDYEFLIVQFKDEHFRELQADDKEVILRIRNFILKGFEAVKHYWFFCASASQLRNRKAYFVAAHSYAEVERLRAKIVLNRSEQKSTAKYLSRLGLFCTSDKPVLPLTSDRMTKVDDMRAQNGDLVTDGCGKVSRDAAEKIWSELQLGGELPAAFQVRLAGIKGVLAVARDNDPQLQHADVIYRDSMLKFKSDNIILGVVNHSSYHKLFLNREVITLLTAIDGLLRRSEGAVWLVEPTIRALHEKALWDAASIFEDPVAARKALVEFLPERTVLNVQDCGFDILTEPFWFGLLRNAYRLSVEDLRKKSRIPLEQGCLLMGIADPIGILKDNEVFVQVQENQTKAPMSIEGPVLIYRNPCLHPGDLRWVTAVNPPCLRRWKNVLILPTTNVSNSLAADCSGGDLDGDLFAVIWDERFIPPCPVRNPALDYAELSKGAPEDFSVEDERSMLASVFCRVTECESLGRIANLHLGLCDQVAKGACDDLAIKLAKSQSQAVDFPKTGILPLVPKDALGIRYPDFMEKDSGYPSEKILGDLYRRCRSSVFDFEMAIEKTRPYKLDPELIVDGYEGYIEDAKEKFEAYKNCMQRVLVHYSLKRESEVVMGSPLSWSPLLTANKGKIMKTIASVYEAISKKYRDEFFRNVPSLGEQRRKASAWYQVAYNNRDSTVIKSFFSFAWIVQDILCGIKQDNRNMNIRRPNMVQELIEESIYSFFFESKSRLESLIDSKQNIMRCIKAEIDRVAGEMCFEVEAYGSSSIYLCSEESDLDVFLKPLEAAFQKFVQTDLQKFRRIPLMEQAKYFLESVVSGAVDKIANSKVHKLNARVPIITITVGDQSRETTVDLSFNAIGYAKTMFMHHLFAGDCRIFVLFWVLVRWARFVGVIKSGAEQKPVQDQPELSREAKRGITEGLIATAEFYVLVIHLLDLKPLERQSKKGKQRNKKICSLKKLFAETRKAKREDNFRVAEMVITFFRRGAMLGKSENETELVWPDVDIPNVSISAQIMKLIAIHCMNGLHSILATRNISTMLSLMRTNSEMEVNFSKKLTKSLVHAIGKATEFHAARLSSVTGANVKITKDNVVLASGTRSSIMKLKEELHVFSVTNRALMLGRLPSKTSRYFMEGSTLIIMKDNPFADSRVSFGASVGPWNMVHNSGERHHPELRSEKVHEWLENAVSRLNERLIQQLAKLPVKNQAVVDSLSTSVVYGSFYTVNISTSLPPSQQTLSVEELGIKIEKGRRNRKHWQRGEFVAQPESSRTFEMEELPKGRENEKKEKPKHKDTKKSSITSSFCSGILAQNSTNAEARKFSKDAYIGALVDCGFELGTNGFQREKVGWQIRSLPSASYEAVVRLDQELRIVAVEERALKWICASFVDGVKNEATNNLMTSHDFRVNIVSRDSIRKGSDLWKKVVPDADTPLLRLEKGGQPVVTSIQQRGRKSCFSLIRHISSCMSYCKENVDAYIVEGEAYSGKDFKVKRTFCDLGIKYNPECLRRLIASEVGAEDCRDFTMELCTTALEISNALKTRVNSQ